MTLSSASVQDVIPGPSRPIPIDARNAIELASRGALVDSVGAFIQISPPIDSSLLGCEPVVAIGGDVTLIHADDLKRIMEQVAASPIAAAALTTTLRAGRSMGVDARLALESATYSALQVGPEFQRWRANRPFRSHRAVDEQAPQDENAAHGETRTSTVRVRRDGNRLAIELARPHHGNAVNRSLRDDLCEALGVALIDGSVSEVWITGAGPHFCTGGDLDEFHTFDSPAEGHLVRLQRSPTRMLAALADRPSVSLRIHLHGNCAGSGVELAAFGNYVTAHTDTTFVLPELSLGLIPGAGGTASIVNRIGADRTAWLLLTGQRIDAATALRWGLIDGISRAIGEPPVTGDGAPVKQV
jgi:enoyl-CoA hydratase